MKKTKSVLFIAAIISFVSCFFMTCKNDKGIPDYNGFPDDIGKIIYTKCATAGCHTDASKGAAGGLSMESWDKLFEGGTGSACIIPYRSDYSTLCYYINTYSDLGTALTPTMPYNKPNLTHDEVLLFKNWIDAGAPTRDGFVKFSDDPNRKKFYVPNQGCDVVTVIDQETLLPMRYINVGSTSGTESPHMVKVSPDGQYWYVSFLGSVYFEKYRTSDDSFVGKAFLGAGSWNTFAISGDSQTAYVIDFNGTGHIATVDLNSLTASVITAGGFTFPHGSALNNTGDTLHITGQQNSQLYKFPVADFSAFSIINEGPSVPSLNSHEIKFTPDGSMYFLTCQGTAEVRAYQTGTDQLLKVFSVGAFPSEMSFSTLAATPYLFVTCTEDTTNISGKRGSVAVINYSDFLAPVQFIYTGHQPHGIEVDDAKGMVYVANRNATNDGPAPHHSSSCGGRNGNVSFIDLHSLTMVQAANGNGMKKVELSVDPYSVAIRH